MRWRRFLIPLLFLLPASALAQESERVLLWRVVPQADTEPETAEDFEEQLRQALSALRPQQVLSSSEIDRLLGRPGNERFLACGRSLPCLAELGLAAGAEKVAAVFLEKAGNDFVSELLLVDAPHSRPLLRARIRHGRALDAAALDRFAQAVFSPARFRGKLQLECPVAGAEVILDGTAVASTPLEGPLEIQAGLRLLEVRKPRHLPFSREVDVPPGGTCLTVALLPEQPGPVEHRPFYRRWLFWTLAGAGAAGLAAGGGLYYDLGILRQNADRARQLGLAEADSWDQKADARAIQSYVAFALGGASLAVAVVTALFDLAGEQDGSPPAKSAFSSFPPAAPLAVFSW